MPQYLYFVLCTSLHSWYASQLWYSRQAGVVKPGVIKGGPTKMYCTFCVIFLATNVPEGWDMIHLKGDVHSSVWSTKTFLYDIREPRYKQLKMGYQITKVLDIGQSSSLKSYVQYCLTYVSAALCFTEMVLNF